MGKNFFRKTVSIFLLCMIVSLIFAGCGSGEVETNKGTEQEPSDSQNSVAEVPTQEDTTDINIWMWDKSESRKQMNEEFTDKYPQYNVIVTAVESKDMAQKLQTTLASEADMPDVAWLEATVRGKLLSLDIWEDLSKPPYNFDKSEILDYLLPLETTEDGVYVGPECPSAAGMAYKRPLAKEYFGTDDPSELQQILGDWDTFIQKGIEVKEKSNGEVFMLASLGDALMFLKGQMSVPFIQDNVLNLEDSVAPILERLIEMKKAGIVDVLEADSPALGASYADSTHIFYPCATWSLEFTIKSNDKNGAGRWGFMIPPGGPFPWGGTVQAVPKLAKNKEGAAELIRYFFLTEEGAAHMRDYKGNFSPYKPVYSDPDFYSDEDEYFAGQDVLKSFSENVFPEIGEVRVPNKYDQDIDDAINLALKTINASTDGNVSVDELTKKMENDIIGKQPDIERQ